MIPVRAVLNRLVPFDAITRWWYILALGPATGLLFSRLTDLKPFNPILKAAAVVGETPSELKTAKVFVQPSGLKDDLLFAVLGFLLACGLIWLLEEIRDYNEQKS